MILPRSPDASRPRPEGSGRVVTDGRQLSQGGSGRRGHAGKLPADPLADGLPPVGSCQPSCLGGVGGRTEGVRAYVRNACGLAGRSRSGRRRRGAHLASGGMSDKTAARLSGAKLAPRKRP